MTESARSFEPPSGLPPHGTMAEEAAKLVELAQLWLGSHATKDRSGDPWAQAVADDGTPPECRGCPVCRVRRALADVNPEVYEHLADAVGSLGAALRALESRGRHTPGA